jgi:phage FluMu protein Com
VEIKSYKSKLERNHRLITTARKVMQVGMIPVRCANCNMLICTASVGSVISVVCGRCKTHNVIQVEKKVEIPS